MSKATLKKSPAPTGVKNPVKPPAKAAVAKGHPAPTKPGSKLAPAATATGKAGQAKGGGAPAAHVEPAPETKALVLGARKRKSTPAIFKIRSRKNTPIVFTLDDVRELIKSRRQENNKPKGKSAVPFAKIPAAPAAKPIPAKSKVLPPQKPRKQRILGAASLADILGVASPPKTQKAVSITQMMDDEEIPSKWRKYYRQLVEMREEIRQGLDMHTQETLKRSSKEDSGDLSGYSQHMADAGTDTFDRDFALSLVSSEQELLFEIEEALKRIRNGGYGVCEITGQTITPERLAAVPFTRYSLDGQKELEKQRKFGAPRGTTVGVFGEATSEDAAAVTDEDAEG